MGDTSRAQFLADDLAKRFPEGTIVHFNYLSVIRAQLALNREQASRAIEEVQPSIQTLATGSRGFSAALNSSISSQISSRDSVSVSALDRIE
jgi:hypothetical protein